MVFYCAFEIKEDPMEISPIVPGEGGYSTRESSALPLPVEVQL